jgi:hypothetical protein
MLFLLEPLDQGGLNFLQFATDGSGNGAKRDSEVVFTGISAGSSCESKMA